MREVPGEEPEEAQPEAPVSPDQEPPTVRMPRLLPQARDFLALGAAVAVIVTAFVTLWLAAAPSTAVVTVATL